MPSRNVGVISLFGHRQSAQRNDAMDNSLEKLGELIAKRGVSVSTANPSFAGSEAITRGFKKVGKQDLVLQMLESLDVPSRPTMTGKRKKPPKRIGNRPSSELLWGLNLGSAMASDAFVFAGAGGLEVLAPLITLADRMVRVWNHVRPVVILSPKAISVRCIDNERLNELFHSNRGGYNPALDSTIVLDQIQIAQTPEDAMRKIFGKKS